MCTIFGDLGAVVVVAEQALHEVSEDQAQEDEQALLDVEEVHLFDERRNYAADE